MITPQELEVWYIIPTIRKELAKAYKELGLTQVEIAKKLDLTPAAVSQYIHKKRGKEEKLPALILQEIKQSAKKTLKTNNQIKILEEIENICSLVRKRGILCKIHKKHSNISLKDCKICLN